MNPEKLAKLQKQVRTGGKGSVRRKRKVAHKTPANTGKLQATLKRLGVNPIPGIEEANFFKDDNTVLHFAQPKVQASVQSNTFVVTGTPQQKDIQELIPSILNQLGPNSMDNLKALVDAFPKGETPQTEEGDDDDIPDLVENFDEVAEEN